MNRHIALLIIDPQNDFCDLPESWRGHDPVRNVTVAPALPVAGAHADMLRLAALIDAVAIDMPRPTPLGPGIFCVQP